MKIIGCYDSINGAKHFKLLHCPIGTRHEATPSPDTWPVVDDDKNCSLLQLRPIGTRYEATLSPDAWTVVDDDYSLLQLLVRNKMLAFEDNEERWAKHKLKALRKIKALPAGDTTFDYCLRQATLVPVYGDDPMYRIATRLLDPQKFTYYDKFGLSSDVRKLILALILEFGVIII